MSLSTDVQNRAQSLPTEVQPGQPIQLSIPLPNAVQTFVYIHLTILKTSLMLFLTTSQNVPGQIREGQKIPVSNSAALGSMVYAMPDRFDKSSTLSTEFFTTTSSIDTTTRIAKILAKRLQVPVYLGNSMNFSGMGNGGSVEEEMAVVGNVVRVVVDEVGKAKKHTA